MLCYLRDFFLLNKTKKEGKSPLTIEDKDYIYTYKNLLLDVFLKTKIRPKYNYNT